ncbi:MAG: hypothetical protein AB7P76_10265 [Candidatus Melainabacteria bacterium]
MSSIGQNPFPGGNYPRPGGQTPGDGAPAGASGATPAAGAAGQTGQVGQPQGAPQAMTYGANALAAMLQAQVSLSGIETAQFLKMLMRLPPDIQQLLAMMAGSEESAGGPDSQWLQLLQQNPHLSLEELQQQLLTRTQDGTNQLVKMLTQPQPQGGRAGNGFCELMNTLTHLQAQIRESPAHALQQTVLLYLPWYPLAAQQNLQLQIAHHPHPGQDGENAETSGENDADVAHLILNLTTRTLGSFRVIIAPVSSQHLLMDIAHDALATTVLPGIQEAMSTQLATRNLPPAEWLTHLRGSAGAPGHTAHNLTEESPGGSAPAGTQDKAIAVQTIGRIPALAVSHAYLFARLVFEADLA